MATLTDSLGDTPHFGFILEVVGRKQPTSIQEGLFVGLTVLFGWVAMAE